MKCFFFLTPIFLSNLITVSLPAPALSLENSVDLIEKTCEKTPYHDLCVSSLRSYPSSSSSTVYGLAGMILNLTLANTTDTLSFIRELIDQTEDPELERSLDICAELYIPVVKYTLPQAIVAFSETEYGFAEYGVSYTGDQADACEEEFSKLETSPIGDRNKLVSELCDVSVAIIKMLR